MDQETLISDIERRAFFAGISISALCKRAKVHPSTFSRWKRSERNPQPIGATLHSIGKLHAALDAVEAERTPRRKAVGA